MSKSVLYLILARKARLIFLYFKGFMFLPSYRSKSKRYKKKVHIKNIVLIRLPVTQFLFPEVTDVI